MLNICIVGAFIVESGNYSAEKLLRPVLEYTFEKKSFYNDTIYFG